MSTTLSFRYYWILVAWGLVTAVKLINGSELPMSTNDVASYSKTVTSTSTCSGGTCNNACPTREIFLGYETPLSEKDANCNSVTGSVNGAIDLNEGSVSFDSTTTDCLNISKTLSPTDQGHFTLSLWIKATANNEVFVDLNNILRVSTNGRLVIETPRSTQQLNVSTNNWIHLAIRYNGELQCFVNNTRFGPYRTSMPAGTVQGQFGPGQNITGRIELADARWFRGVLTDREIESLYTGANQLSPLKILSECRCPPNAPRVDSDSLPENYGLYCTNGTARELRLNPGSHHPVFLIDGDNNTYWTSGSVNNVEIDLELKKSVQVKSCSIRGLEVPGSVSTLVLTFSFAGQPTGSWTFAKSCNGMNPCLAFDQYYSADDKLLHYVMEGNVANRPEYTKLRADKVTIELTATSQGFFNISEIAVEARCDCHVNDKNCILEKGDYSCNCGTSTDGTNCQECEDKYYRETDEQLNCSNSCSCDTDGSTAQICNKIGGDCSCKTNTQGRQCNECKHNTADLGSDTTNGCKSCSCNPDGIISCNGTDLTCHCKPHVNTSDDTCGTCEHNFYNISGENGCTDCDCDGTGATDVTAGCDAVTGQCGCKTGVGGRACDVCMDEYFELTTQGCKKCACNFIGSTSLVCNKATGQCDCSSDTSLRTCDSTVNYTKPLYGPVAGGTFVTIIGENLYSPFVKDGSVEVRLDGEKQDNISANATSIVFKTVPTNLKTKPDKRNIRITWTKKSSDTSSHSTLKFEFEYRENATLNEVDMDVTTYVSGGCSFSVTGTHLDSIPEPKLLLHQSDFTETHPCCSNEGECSASKLTCKTPRMDTNNNGVDSYTYGFKLDNIMAYETVKGAYTVFRDPEIVQKDMIFKNTFDKVLEIEGTRLAAACSDGDVKITLGDEDCPLVSRDNGSLTCEPAESFPGSSRQVQVVVWIGTFQKIVGTLEIKSFWNTTEFYGIAGGVGGLFLIIVIIIVVCNIRGKKSGDERIPRISFRKSQPRRPNSYIDMKPGQLSGETNMAIQMEELPARPRVGHEAPTPVSTPADKFCDRLDYQTGKIIRSSLVTRADMLPGILCTHKGKRARVIVGQFTSSASTSYSGQNLTLKTLVDSYPKEGDLPGWMNDELLESTRLRDFSNDHVLRMMGIAVDDSKVYILYPEMDNRTLKDYLIKDQENPVPDDLRLNFCVQAAEGMNYLSTQGIVHRDLACRNCWLDKDKVLKIADHAFSADLYQDEYMERNGHLQPIRWMAPESLEQAFYDIRSDVWSFGVLMWEVFTNGALPYGDLENAEVVEDITKYDFRLGKPHDCHDQIYDLMEQCFRKRGDHRPNFFVIENTIGNIIFPAQNMHVSYINAKSSESANYANRDETTDGHTEEMYVNTEGLLQIAQEVPPRRPPSYVRPPR